MRAVYGFFNLLLAFGLLSFTGCAQYQYGEDDFRMNRGYLLQGDDTFTIEAIEADDALGMCQGDKSVMIPAMAQIAKVGGEAVSFDLQGFSADGRDIDPVGVETVSIVAERAEEQRMGALVNVLGDLTDPEVRENATKTAAYALKDEGRAVYWFDGPNAAELAKTFKKRAPKLVVAAPDNGDLKTITTLPAERPEKTIVLLDQIPPFDDWTSHYILRGDDKSYEALDLAKMTEEEKEPWTPDNSVLSEEEREEGFIALFNGRNLDGWWWFGFNKNTFKVVDGTIEYQETGGKAIQTVDRYSDFILRLEYKIEDGGNSGIFLRAPRAARQSKIGMEFQLKGDHGKEPDKNSCGAIYDVGPPKVNASKPAGEWNTVEIICDGPRVKATMNGQLVQDINLDDDPELKYRLREGFIGLQDHHNYVAFRNVRLKEL